MGCSGLDAGVGGLGCSGLDAGAGGSPGGGPVQWRCMYQLSSEISGSDMYHVKMRSIHKIDPDFLLKKKQ